MQIWAYFIAVVLSSSLDPCASFHELYAFGKLYGDTKNRMKEEEFIVMKRVISETMIPGEDQGKEKEHFDCEAEEDLTGNLDPWETLIKMLCEHFTCQIFPEMIDNYQYEVLLRIGNYLL